MTEKTYIMQQMKQYGFKNIAELPEEMLDYLPENLDRDELEEV